MSAVAENITIDAGHWNSRLTCDVIHLFTNLLTDISQMDNSAMVL